MSFIEFKNEAGSEYVYRTLLGIREQNNLITITLQYLKVCIFKRSEYVF